MERQLPVYIIEGTRFIVDIQKAELRQKDNPENVIPFDEMRYTGSGYSFSYDREEKNIPFLSSKEEHIKEVEIPMLVVLDPAGIAEKYNIPLDTLGRKTDFDIIVDPEWLEKRIIGVLPTVDIAGHEFIVDYRLNELRPKDDFTTSIRLGELYFDNGADCYRAFYHPATHKIADIDTRAIREIPDGLVEIEIPHIDRLDPYAAAREFCIDPKEMLLRYPPQKQLRLVVRPAEQTRLPSIVQKNKERELRAGDDMESKQGMKRSM